MSDDPPEFEDIFLLLFGYPPMRWQHRLFDRFTAGQIPPALDLPTGLGKTSVMAIWLLARALAEAAALKAIPRRLVYVVDRRAVVDQATEEAVKLRNALDGDAIHLKERLGLDGPLPISTLRGAYAGNRQWLADPVNPAIIVGTVDMIGSRLLFEGYGVSRRMRPYHAGLLGADTLVVLDEAHLVPPFEALLRRVDHRPHEFGPRAPGDRELIPAFKVMSLSATGRGRSTSDCSAADIAFSLEDDDLSDRIVVKRLAAKKTLKIEKIDDVKDDALADSLAGAARAAIADDQPIRCVVYCDRRVVAERVKEKLDRDSGLRGASLAKRADVELFVGARRVREREDARTWLRDHSFLAGSGLPEKPAILIATAAGEVGVDLDADHMVCDLVAWERMVQRLGRVNRRGDGDAIVTLICSAAEPNPKNSDSPTQEEQGAIVQFRALLALLDELPDVRDGDGKDVSPGTLRALKLRADTDEALRDTIAAATTPEPLRPELSRPLVDAWSMTALQTHTGRPDIAPWLRGWVDECPQTTLIWRSHLPIRVGVASWPRTVNEKREVEEFFQAAPPQESEKLETETYRVTAWLHDRAAILVKDQSEVAGRSGKDEDADVRSDDDSEGGYETIGRVAAPGAGWNRDSIVAFAMSPASEYKRQLTLGELARKLEKGALEIFEAALIGVTLIVDARFGGLKDGLLQARANDDIQTADGCDDWSHTPDFRVRRTSVGYDGEQDAVWRFEDEFVVHRNREGESLERLVVEHFRYTPQSEDGRSISGPQELAKHQYLVERQAGRIAAAVGLPEIAAEALSLAARLHDEGKKAARWQRAFAAPQETDGSGEPKIFAKTEGPINQKILDGYRHEFGSLPYVEANAKFRDLPFEWQDLVLHLVAAHHGQARPVIAMQGCDDAPPSALQDRAADAALRFARLQKRWGPWGLAWWESLLRAADQQASRDKDEGTGPGLPDKERN